MLPFKRGAFEGLNTVIPLILKYTSCRNMGPTWECLGFIEQIIAVCSYGWYYDTMTILPPLKPTDYMFEKYADKGASKAEVYAYVAREIMCKVSGFPKIESQSRDKAAYKAFMTGKVDEIEHSGKKFTAPPIHSIFPCLRKKSKTNRKEEEKPK